MARHEIGARHRFEPTKVDLSRVEQVERKHWVSDPWAVIERGLAAAHVDDSGWSVKLTPVEIELAHTLARREVGLEVCEWRREVVGWTPGVRPMIATCEPIVVLNGRVEELEFPEVPEELASKPIYGLVEHWRPVDS